MVCVCVAMVMIVFLDMLVMCCLSVNKHDDMLIHIAAMSGSLDIVKYLIQKAAVGVDVKGEVS